MYQLSPRAVMARHLVPFPTHTPLARRLPAGYRSITDIFNPSLSGLGQNTGAVVTADASKIASGTLTSMSAFGVIGTTSLAVPIIGAAICAVTIVLGLLFNRKGPKQKVATTTIANRVEPALLQNLNAYLAGPRTVSSQKQALANFDAGWAYLVEYCDCPEMGDPGKACVSDRQSGACTWKASPGIWSQDLGGNWTWTPAGAAGSGTACWNWYVGYRDPIANDPAVIPDPVLDPSGNLVTLSTDPSTGQVVSTTYTGTGSASSSSTYLLLGGALIVGALVLGGGGGR